MRKTYIRTKEHIEKMSKIKTGKKRPDLIGNSYRKGKSPANKGKHFPELSGKNSPAWRGGVSSIYRRKIAPRPEPEQCEVCGTFGKEFKKGLHLDHDHNTNKFRGWLCHRCNCALGMVKDNPETLEALAKYLRVYRGT
jgi:hypothetical protein